MRQLDHIVWVSDSKTSCVAVKNVRDNEFWVPGHLPGRPLLPGVMMIEAAGQSSSVLYRVKTGLNQFIGFIRCDDAAESYRRAIREQRFAMIVDSNTRFIHGYPDDGLLERHYRMAGWVFPDPEVFVPISGARIRPGTYWVPK